MAKHAAEAALVEQLAHAQRLHAERASNPILAGTTARLAEWQSRRLGQTYADLAAQPRYRAAIAFFQSDLYGNEEMARRDSDVARVVPLLVKMLPERVIATLARAMELNVLSHELDLALLAQLPRADASFSVAEYCRAYRRAGRVADRRKQIALIGEIGRALEVFVRTPLIRGALAMMRQPARLAGYATLHDLLERGFAAFLRMHGAETFLATIEARETALLEKIVDGSNDPFPDPLNRLGLVSTAPEAGATRPSSS